MMEETESPLTGEEPRMRTRDADLRALIHTFDQGPGTDLYWVLAALQRYRDATQAKETRV